MSKEKHSDMEIMLKISELTQQFDQKDKNLFYNKIFDLLLNVIDYTYATIFLLDHEDKKIKLEAQKGKAIDLIELVNFEFGKGFSAWVAKERKTILLNDIGKNSMYHEKSFRSFLSLPMLLENELIGVINFGHVQANAFLEESLPKLKIITSMLAGLIANQQHIKKLRKQNEEIRIINNQLRDTQQKLIEAEQKATISAMAVSLNHEINNPLMIISANLEMLQYSSKNEKTKSRINNVRTQFDRITNVIRQLRMIESPMLESYIDGDNTKMLKLSKTVI